MRALGLARRHRGVNFGGRVARVSRLPAYCTSVTPGSCPAPALKRQLQDCHAFVAIRLRTDLWRRQGRRNLPVRGHSTALGGAGAAGRPPGVPGLPRRSATLKRRERVACRLRVASGAAGQGLGAMAVDNLQPIESYFEYLVLARVVKMRLRCFSGSLGTGMRTDGGHVVPMSQEASMTRFRGRGREAAPGDRSDLLSGESRSCKPSVAIDKSAERGLDLPLGVPRVRTFKGLVSGPPL